MTIVQTESHVMEDVSNEESSCTSSDIAVGFYERNFASLHEYKTCNLKWKVWMIQKRSLFTNITKQFGYIGSFILKMK